MRLGVVGLVVLVVAGVIAVSRMLPLGNVQPKPAVRPKQKAAAAVPAVSVKDAYQGLSLVPGEYKAAWILKEPKADEPRTTYGVGPLDPRIRAKMSRAVSARACAFSAEGFWVVLDESGGRYDMAYVLPEIQQYAGGRIDMEKAWRVPLKRDGNYMTNDGCAVKLRLGSGAIEKPGEIRLKVELRGGKPDYVEFTWLGGWYGKIQTSDGIYGFELNDTDRNGRYDGSEGVKYLCPGCGKYHSMGTDTLHVDGSRTSCGLSGNFSEDNLCVRGVDLFAGKLYAFEVSPSGDSLWVKPYAGPAGTVTIKAVDGFGKRAGFSVSLRKGDREFTVSGVGSRTLKMPPGEYDLRAIVGVPGASDAGNSQTQRCIRVLHDGPTIKVADGGDVTVKVGGAVAFVISPSQRPITVKFGAKKPVSVVAKVSGLNVYSLGGNYDGQVTIRVLDSAGRKTKEIAMRPDNLLDGQSASVDAGGLKPGDYTIAAAYDFRPYGPSAESKAKIRVTK